MAFHIVKNIFYFLICVASVGSNSLLIAILLRFEHLRTTANLFVLNLALCDVATVLLSIPFTVIIEESTSYPFGELGCKLLMPSATAAFNSAAFTLLAIAIDRFYAIMFPMRARLQTCKMKSLAVCLLHGVSVLSVIPFITHLRLIKDGNSYKCIEDWPNGGSQIYTLVLFGIQYAVPLTVIAVLYIISWNQIRKKNKVIIKMQELQQKGKCHFSRSQSWDVAMKKSEPYSFLLEEAAKVADKEKQVVQSTSSYSFVSSQLEAVAETMGNDGSQKADGSKTDDGVSCDDTGIQRAEDEQIIMIDMSKSRLQLEKVEKTAKSGGNEDLQAVKSGGNEGRQTVKSGGNEDQQTEKSGRNEDQHDINKNGVDGHSKRANTTLKTDREEYGRRQTPRVDRGLHVKDSKSNSARLKLRNSLPFTSRCPWIKSDCWPKRMRRSKRNWKERLARQKESISEAHDSDSTEAAGRQGNWKGGSFTGGSFKGGNFKGGSVKGDLNTSDILESTANADFKTQPEDTEATALVQGKSARLGHATKRGNSQTETARRAFNKSFDRDSSTIGHSMSSPALGTNSSHGHTRRQSSQTSLFKASGNAETRLSRISQIAMHARQKVSQALTTTSSSENMCSASVKRMKQTRRTLRMFTCVVVVFAVCILPNQITWIWMAFNGAHLNHVFYTVFYFLTYTNSVINPWIYGAVNPSFREAYRKVFCCQSHLNMRRKSALRRSSSKLTYLCATRAEIEATSSRTDA